MRRSLLRLGVGVMSFALAATYPATGVAEPAASSSLTSPAVESATVTLITGHRIQVETLPDGRQAVIAIPSPTGTRANIKVVERQTGLYVIPTEAQLPIVAGSLDQELFNVTGLIEQGYDDESTDAIPVIVTYSGNPPARASGLRPAPEHSQRTATLESIDGIAAATPKADSAAFWDGVVDDLATGDARRSSAGIEKIWLDGAVRADLSESVPQIGAPQAWAAGLDGAGVRVAVLDTGYDPDHPDLQGKVSLAQDFSFSHMEDGNGHGTHVAATVAGSGAASDGKHQGVAPGADLVIGKVLGDDGTGQNSWLIDGMEWAVAQDADIVSMSLSSEASDGSDPLSQAVNSLTASSGALFVAAAGNNGPGEGTVKSPGVADAALSVGAVDKSDRLVEFSSRGPRMTNYAVKPDITAPGVGIVAARASGTGIGDPVDDMYTSLSGTSMATPHVAGAAAILQQQHPDWDAAELKRALTGSSRVLDDYTVYEQGAGRVDLARAITQMTFADVSTLDFGKFAWPHDGTHQTVTRTVTYTNESAEPVTLDLSVDVTDETGAVPASGMFALSASTITVPARGSAPVDLTVDANLGATGLYGGRLSAVSENGTAVYTTIGLFKEHEMIEVTVDAIAHDGSPAGGSSSAELWSLDTDHWESGLFGRKGGGSGPVTFRVRPGTYSMLGFLFTQDEAKRYDREVAVVGDTELTLTEDTHLVLDGRNANPINVETPRPTEHQGLTLGYYRKSEAHNFNLRYLFDKYMDVAYAEPTEPVERGTFEFTSQWELFAPELTMRVSTGAAAPLQAEYAIGSPKVDGRHRYPIVDAGTGAPDDVAELDLGGALALIRRSDAIGVDAQVAAAAAAGAEAVVIYHDQPGWLLLRVNDDSPIPAVTISRADGERIADALADGTTTEAELRGVAVSPYLYDLMLPEADQIPTSLQYDIEHDDLARLATEFVATGAHHFGNEARHAFRPYDNFSLRTPREVLVPSRRLEWVSAGDTSWRQLAWAEQVLVGGLAESLRSYEPGEVDPRSWFAPIVRPGVPDDVEYFGQYGMPGFRDGDEFTILIRSFLDGHGNNGDGGSADEESARLYRDGELVAERNGVYGTWPAAADPATYRLELDVARTAPWWRHSTQTFTAWTFTSAQPASSQREMLPLLQVDYDIDTDMRAEVSGHSPLRLGMRIHQQGAAEEIEVGGVRLAASFDDGATWQPVTVIRHDDGRFSALVRHEPGAEFVSLRVEAWDDHGNAIEQTVIRAYGVTGD